MMMTRLVIRTMWLVTILMVGFAQGFQRLGLVHRCNLLSASSLGSSRLHQSSVLDMDKIMDTRGMQFSGLQGKALVPREYPTLGEVKAAMPADVFVKSTTQSLSYAAIDLCTTGLWMTLGVKYMLPTAFSLFSTGFALNQIAAILLFAFYSLVGGTFGIGMWVTAHECGHGAFSDNRRLQDFVGYLYHSLWLVPYFSWQRSHAVHHANTNHIIDGETHVPPIVEEEVHVSDKKKVQRTFGDFVGESLFGTLQVLTHLFVGWPAYLLLGVTGGPSRGFTNHFLPVQFPRSPNHQNENSLKTLFPGAWKKKVLLSDIGVVAMAGVLIMLAQRFGTAFVLAAYGGPYLFVNAWLVAYTWLQHTDVDVPHLPSEGYSYMKGAFHTIDRPYTQLLGGVIDFLHHHIGSTHVAHHIDSSIPHYKARVATDIIAKTWPHLYLYEPTPVLAALWRVATKCFEVVPRRNAQNEELFVFVD